MTNNDIAQEQKRNLHQAYEKLLDTCSLSELDAKSGLIFSENPDWCGWVFDMTGISLEDVECQKLHAWIRRAIKERRPRTVRPS